MQCDFDAIYTELPAVGTVQTESHQHCTEPASFSGPLSKICWLCLLQASVNVCTYVLDKSSLACWAHTMLATLCSHTGVYTYRYCSCKSVGSPLLYWASH